MFLLQRAVESLETFNRDLKGNVPATEIQEIP
jgi:hypothetical protein